DVSTHSLAVEAHSARNGRNADALSVQFKDHDDLPKSNQRRTPQKWKRGIIAYRHRLLARTLSSRSQPTWGIFNRHKWGLFRRHSHATALEDAVRRQVRSP